MVDSMEKIYKKLSFEKIHYSILLVSLLAMAGSLFFSEVMKLPPCLLCWYQRIALYPLVFLAAVGIIRADKKLYTYILPISVVGLGISIYHNLLYWKILPESIAPCTLGVSCTTKFFEWFGFITIPFLALVAFVVITALAFISLKKNKNEKS
jgi:disulfide bond formation protein DsbB